MGRVIAIANQKGGVAKTTTTANLGAALSEAGHRVLLIDMDPQGSLTVWSGRNPDDLDKTMYDSLIKGMDSREILLPTPLGPDLLPANIELSLAEMDLLGTIARERRLAGVLAPLRDEYDFILMDAQPSLGLLTVNVFAAADEVLVPVVAEFLSTRAVDVLLRMMRQVKLEQNSKLKLVGFVPTMFDGRLRHARAELEELERRFGAQAPVLVGCVVPRTVRFAEAAAAGRSMLQFLPYHPGSEAYRRLARFLTGDEAAGLTPPEEQARQPSMREPAPLPASRDLSGWRPFADDEDRAARAGTGAIDGAAGAAEAADVGDRTIEADAKEARPTRPTRADGAPGDAATPGGGLGERPVMPEPRIDVFVRKQDSPRRRRR